MPRYAARTDDNHAKVVAEFRSLFPEAEVFDASGAGKGFPDLVVGWKNRNFLIELKDPNKVPSQRKLTPAQVKFHGKWPGQVDVCHTATEIIEVITTS